MTKTLGKALAILWLASQPLAAQTEPEPATITAAAPETMVLVMQNLGYRAIQTTDSDGDPKINSSASGVKFAIYFYGCKEGAACKSIQFYSAWDWDSPIPLAAMNDWNRSNRFGTALFDDENDPAIKMDLDLDFGGITTPAFKDRLELWEILITDFKDHLTASESHPETPAQETPKDL